MNIQCWLSLIPLQSFAHILEKGMVTVVSIQHIFLVMFYCPYIFLNCNSHQFNLYHTKHHLNKLSRDCLYYFIVEHETVPQFIPYCTGSSSDGIQSTKSVQNHQSFTFEDLRKLNVSSYQLYTWSAPIDLIEHYQIYLDKHSLVDNLVFYNCTYPWFGTYCEYSFDRNRSDLYFADQIQLSFLEKTLRGNYIPANLPCYTHLICDRSGDHGQIAGACLDWREVCDGKINCLNNQNDEEHCWQLEINECDPQTEFRCHNGMCIPLSFLNDDIHNPDCLDRSDEYDHKLNVKMDSDGISKLIVFRCHTNPAFKCEEHRQRPQKSSKTHFDTTLECGDGVATNVFPTACENGRDKLLLIAMITAANVSDQCRIAFECVTGFYIQYTFDNSKTFTICHLGDNSKYVPIVQQSCPSLIELGPMIYGVVRLVYSNNVSKVSEKK